MGTFTFPYGMAGTQIVKRFIDYCIDNNCSIKVFTILERNNRKDKNKFKGIYNNKVPYFNFGVISGSRILDILQYPIILVWSLILLIIWKDKNKKNRLYVYDNINIFNFLQILFAKTIGYKVIVEIIEDYSLNEEVTSLFRELNIKFSLILEKKLLRLSDSIIVISKYLENKFKLLYKDKIPILLIPVSTDFNNKSIGKKENNVFTFLYAGTFGKKDGLETLINAFSIFNKKYPNSILNLIGNSNHINHIKQLLINEKIKYLGAFYGSEYFDILNRSDVLCMTRTNTKYANAGFPHKIAEYLSTGIPVICTDVSDIKYYLKDRKDAVIIEPDNVNALYEAMQFLYLDTERRNDIGNNGKIKAETFFNSKINGKLFLGFISR